MGLEYQPIFNSLLKKPPMCYYVGSIAASFFIDSAKSPFLLPPPPPQITISLRTLCLRSCPLVLRASTSTTMRLDQPTSNTTTTTLLKPQLHSSSSSSSSFGSIANAGVHTLSLHNVQTHLQWGSRLASIQEGSIVISHKFGVRATSGSSLSMAEPYEAKIREILASNLDPVEKLRLIVEEMRLVDKENIREAVMMLTPEEREELDRRARNGEEVVPGGAGGKSLEAQIHLAEGRSKGGKHRAKIRQILASNLDPAEKLRLIVEDMRLVDKENIREAVMMLTPEEREELDRRARNGEEVVPGGAGGKSLEAQINRAEGRSKGGKHAGLLRAIASSNLDPAEKLRRLLEEMRLIDKENVRLAVSLLTPEEREELDRRARNGEVVVPGGSGGKTLEAQIELAEGRSKGGKHSGRIRQILMSMMDPAEKLRLIVEEMRLVDKENIREAVEMLHPLEIEELERRASQGEVVIPGGTGGKNLEAQIQLAEGRSRGGKHRGAHLETEA